MLRDDNYNERTWDIVECADELNMILIQADHAQCWMIESSAECIVRETVVGLVINVYC